MKAGSTEQQKDDNAVHPLQALGKKVSFPSLEENRSFRFTVLVPPMLFLSRDSDNVLFL